MVVSPAPDCAETKFLYAVRRFHIREAIPAINDPEIVEKFKQGRRIESQSGEFDTVTVYIENNGFLFGNEQPPQDSKLGGFAPEKLDQVVRVIQGTGLNDHLLLCPERAFGTVLWIERHGLVAPQPAHHLR